MTRRMLNSELFRNVELGECDPQVRLLYIGMIVNADDAGRMRAHPKYLRAAIFPFDLLDDVSMTKMRDRLVERKLIVVYEVDGEAYIQHPKWEKWQILRKDRMKSSDCPSPRNQLATICQPSVGKMRTLDSLTEVNRTEPKLTEPKKTPLSESLKTALPDFPPQGSLFEKIWMRYPKRDGKKAAARHFKLTVKSMTDWLNIQNALDNYLSSETVKKGFIKNGSTWFNNWQDWINYTEDAHAPHVSKSFGRNSSFVRGAIEAQGLRKADFSGTIGKIFDGSGNDPVPEIGPEKSDR